MVNGTHSPVPPRLFHIMPCFHNPALVNWDSLAANEALRMYHGEYTPPALMTLTRLNPIILGMNLERMNIIVLS